MAVGFREGSLLGGRYRLERRLATGGMASVWLARDERLGRPVAAKMLSDTLAGEAGYVRRFRREARLAARLSHPNLVAVYDFGWERERPWLAMEYVEGGSLADRISAGTARGLEGSRLARELLEALDCIHRAGIVHRDVKPANVLVAPDGSAKLTDFGIALPEGATRLTGTGLVVGTRSYIAPEVGRGEAATVRSDLYSCGIVLREAIDEGAPAELAELVARLCEDDPARRPQSTSGALALLTAAGAEADAAATEPLAPERTGRATPIRARARRHGLGRPRVLVGPALLAGLALVAALIGAGVILLGGGDEGSSAGDGTPAKTTRQRAPTTATGEGAGRQQQPPTEPSAQPGERNEGKPPKTPPGKAKEEKRSKAPPGKPKGHGKG